MITTSPERKPTPAPWCDNFLLSTDAAAMESTASISILCSIHSGGHDVDPYMAL